MVYQQTDGGFEINPVLHTEDTIVSTATPPGAGAVGIVRVSGVAVLPLIETLFGLEFRSSLMARKAYLRTLRDSLDEAIDQVILLYFSAPHSFTGEDVLELQAHGGDVVLQMILHRVLGAAQTENLSLRIAQPGEFSKRAFLNNKIDLAQAEAIASLIEAKSEMAAKSAMRSLQGAFSLDIHQLQKQLNHIRVFVEATLDFPEEEIEFLEREKINEQLHLLRETLWSIFQKASQGSLLQEGIRLAIVGQPNTGKSSLLNCLAGVERAIVTPIAGTTRDKIEEKILIHGIPIHLVDTAGLRPTEDEVEKIGVSKAWEEAHQADIVLLLHDASRMHVEAYQKTDAEIEAELLASREGNEGKILHIYNKADLIEPAVLEMANGQPPALYISTKTDYGIEGLRIAISHMAGWQDRQEGVYLARKRHLLALEHALQHIDAAMRYIQSSALMLDLIAEELRLAQKMLDSILGEYTADDLLGQIFSSFCIGK